MGLIEQYAAQNRGFANARYENNNDHYRSVGILLAQARYMLLKMKELRNAISPYPMLVSSAENVSSPLALTGTIERKNVPLLTGPAGNVSSHGDLTTYGGVAYYQLNKAVIPPLAPGADRFNYFTGRVDRGEVDSLLTQGIELRDYKEGVGGAYGSGMYKGDFDRYMFNERGGELGYIVVIDIPEHIASEARALARPPGHFYDRELEPFIFHNGKLKPEFILGAIDQKTGQWIDKALIVNKDLGGIDLTQANKYLQTKNGDGEIKFHMDPAMLRQFQNAPGFVPVIINIQPMNDLRTFLGLNDFY